MVLCYDPACVVRFDWLVVLLHRQCAVGYTQVPATAADDDDDDDGCGDLFFFCLLCQVQHEGPLG